MAGSVTYKILKTPVAEEVALGVIIEESILAENPDILPKEGALYSQMNQRIQPQELSSMWNNWRYLGQEDAPAGKFMLVFGKVKSQQKRDTPFRELPSMGNHRWHQILDAINFIKDHNFLRSTNGLRGGKGAVVMGPSYYARNYERPEVTEGTRFITQEFFSDVPYKIPSYPVPVPRSVSYDIPGVRGGNPLCLGPAIRIPGFQSAQSAFTAGDSAAISANGAISGQYFGATNFEEWSPYVLTDQQTFQNGYYRHRVWVWPPLIDEEEIIR